MKKLLLILFFFTGVAQGQAVINSYSHTVTGGGGLPITATVRLLVDDATSLTTADTAVKAILDTNITTVGVTDPDNMDTEVLTYDFTVIAESILSSSVSSLKSETKPIITLEGSNHDEFDMGTAGSSNDLVTTISKVQEHDILGDLTFPLDVNIGGSEENQGKMDKDNDATSTAYLASSDAHSLTFAVIAFDTGDTLGDSSTATGKRVFIAGFKANLWSDDFIDIFINALIWVN